MKINDEQKQKEVSTDTGPEFTGTGRAYDYCRRRGDMRIVDDVI